MAKKTTKRASGSAKPAKGKKVKKVKRAKKKKAAKKPAAKTAKARAAEKKPAPAAAAANEVNKSQAIREVMADNPRLKPAAIAATLQEQGIHVSAQYVSTIKSNHKKQRQRRLSDAADAKLESLPADISVKQLLEVRELVNSLGGIHEVQRALDVLQQLQ